jgi:hypothetical protein
MVYRKAKSDGAAMEWPTITPAPRWRASMNAARSPAKSVTLYPAAGRLASP